MSVLLSDPKHLKQQLKQRRITPQMVLALSGRTACDPSGFNKWLRDGRIPADVAEMLSERFGITL